jgi:hypothetical protein
MFKVSIKTTITAILLVMVATISKAQPSKFRTMFRDDPATTLVVGWSQEQQSSLNGSNFRLYYSKTDYGTDTSAYKNDNEPVSPQNIVESFKTMNHYFVRLSNLESNTPYYFVIAYNTTVGITTEVTERYWSTTMPDDPAERLSIISGGDSREDLEHPDQTLQSITIRREANRMVAKLNPHIVFFGGDYTFASADNEWIDWLNDWELTYSSTNKITPIIAAAGNHEYAPFGGAQAGSQILTSIFDVPHNDVYYALTFGGNLLRLYTLNTEVAISGDQSNWLRDDLALTNKSVHWKMAQYHKPIRPHESGKSDQNTAYAEWAQAFYDYQVRLVFESDAHVVKTTYGLMPTELSSGELNEEGYQADMNFVRTEDRGTVYVGEGTWAALRDGNDAKAWTRSMGGFNQVKWVWVSQGSIEVRTVVTFDINDEEYVSNIEELTDVNRFTEPTGIQLWEPAEGKVVTLRENGLTDRGYVPNLAPYASFPDVTLNENDGEVVAFSLNDYATDENEDSLSFTIISESAPSIVKATIQDDAFIATTQTDKFGFSNVGVEVFDGEFTYVDMLQLFVEEQDATVINEHSKILANVFASNLQKGVINIQFNNPAQGLVGVSIYDLRTGKIVYQKKHSASTNILKIQTRNISQGIYYVSVENNGKTAGKKISF